MLRDDLCKAFLDFKVEFRLSYSGLSDLTGLNRTQLFNILKNNGAEVKLETIEEALCRCGIRLDLEVSQPTSKSNQINL